jgi:predicted CoA-binding protein
MRSNREAFWQNRSFAFVGHSSEAPFPKLSYGELKKRGGKVVAVDPSVDSIDGDPAYDDLASLPEPVDAVVLAVPRDETAAWVERAAAAGCGHPVRAPQRANEC